MRNALRLSPLLAPDSSAVRGRLLGSSVLHEWRWEKQRQRDENVAHIDPPRVLPIDT